MFRCNGCVPSATLNSVRRRMFHRRARRPGTEGSLPVQRELLQKQARLGVLDLAAESGMGQPLPKGRAGDPVHFAFGSYSAHVAEVSVTDGKVRCVAWCAHRLRRYVNPGIIAAQTEGGAIFGLRSALSELTFDHGRLQQTNFHTSR